MTPGLQPSVRRGGVLDKELRQRFILQRSELKVWSGVAREFGIHDENGFCIGKLLGVIDTMEVGAIRADGPEVFREAAMSRTRKLAVAAGAPHHFGFEIVGGKVSDFVWVFALPRFVITGQSVGVTACSQRRGGSVTQRAPRVDTEITRV
jgi:hypothetical protein